MASLLSKGVIDERMPQCPDVEEKWEQVAQSYLPDGMREFNAYPLSSLGWMMYIGMAVAKYWDEYWEFYGHMSDIYAHLLSKVDYDHLDEYILQRVLELGGEDLNAVQSITGDCAARADSALRHSSVEAGSSEAFHAYVACLHQLYLMGMAMQLHRMGYHMTRVQ